MYSYGFTSDNYTFGAADAWSNTYSLSFDGVDENVDVGSVAELNSVTNLSVSFWAKLNDASYRLVFGDYVSSSVGLWIDFNSATDNVGFYLRNGVGNVSARTGSVLSTNTWYHILVTYDGGAAAADRPKIYVDGVDQALTFTGTFPTSSGTYSDIRIAGVTGFSPHNGLMDEVRVYDYTLSSANVTDIYNSGTPKDDDLATKAVHWWQCGDGSDTISTINDVGTAGGNDGTPQNMESGDIQTDVP